jgi:hypothetical protein
LVIDSIEVAKMLFIFVSLKQKRTYYCSATHFITFTKASSQGETYSLHFFLVDFRGTNANKKFSRQNRYQVTTRFSFAHVNKPLARLH